MLVLIAATVAIRMLPLAATAVIAPLPWLFVAAIAAFPEVAISTTIPELPVLEMRGRAAIIALAAEGTAVVIISQDLDEIFLLAGRTNPPA